MSIKQNGVMIAGGNQLDNVPTSGSTNPVSSGGVYTALAGKVTTGHEVIEFQAPTLANNYTWYRKYADGWVEQGGYVAGTSAVTATVVLPIQMADAYYYANVSNVNSSTSANATLANVSVWDRTTTEFKYRAQTTPTFWEAKGMAGS